MSYTLADSNVLLYVFTEIGWPWDTWLGRPLASGAKLPSFHELYRDPAIIAGEVPVLDKLLLRLETIPNTKAFLTSQKGTGKSWALRHLGEQIARREGDADANRAVVHVSMTDAVGGTFVEASLVDILLLITGGLAGWLHRHRAEASPAELDTELATRIRAWAGALAPQVALPDLPHTPNSESLYPWLDRLGNGVRARVDLRAWMRENVKPDELLALLNWFLRVGEGVVGLRPLLLVENVDKVKPDIARETFREGTTVLHRIETRLVMTYPFALNFEGGIRAFVPEAELACLRNVPVTHKDAPPDAPVDENGVRWFRSLLEPLVDLDLLDSDVIVEAARLSGGVVSEFGRLIQSAYATAVWMKAPRVSRPALDAAVRGLERDLLRASQGPRFHERLLSIAETHQLSDPLDFELLNANLVVEYVNETTPV